MELERAGFPEARLAVTKDAPVEAASRSPEQAVPGALMVTELNVNAIKHGASAPNRVTIGMSSRCEPAVAVLYQLTAAQVPAA